MAVLHSCYNNPNEIACHQKTSHRLHTSVPKIPLQHNQFLPDRKEDYSYKKKFRSWQKKEASWNKREPYSWWSKRRQPLVFELLNPGDSTPRDNGSNLMLKKMRQPMVGRHPTS